MGYVNSIAKKVFAEQTYDFVTSRLVTSVLERIVKLDPLINMYYNYLQSDADVLNTYHENFLWSMIKKLFVVFTVQEYLLDTVLENIADDNWNV